jgi:hypothetical protein
MVKSSQPNLISLDQAKRISHPIIYALYDGAGMFYVGKTMMPCSRFYQHRTEPSNNQHLRRRIKAAGDALRVEILAHRPPDLSQAKAGFWQYRGSTTREISGFGGNNRIGSSAG